MRIYARLMDCSPSAVSANGIGNSSRQILSDEMLHYSLTDVALSSRNFASKRGLLTLSYGIERKLRFSLIAAFIGVEFSTDMDDFFSHIDVRECDNVITMTLADPTNVLAGRKSARWSNGSKLRGARSQTRQSPALLND